MADLRLAIVTDIHHGPNSYTKRGDRALPLLDDFLAFCADYGPDMIVEMGDRISDLDRETDRKHLEEVAAKFRVLNTPRAHIDGNHDSDFLLPEDNAAAVDSGKHASRDLNGFHLVFWNADTKIPRPEPFRASEGDLAWLAQDLAATDLPTLIFSHVPFGGVSMTGNYWFQNNPEHATYPNAPEIRAIVEASDKVVLCAAGHVHWNSLQRVNAIPYITVQSLSESYATAGEPCGAWATLELDLGAWNAAPQAAAPDAAPGQIRWRTYGLDPIEMTLPLRRPGESWTECLPPFAELNRR